MGSERGDTFVEVIIAVALVGLALIGITGVISTGLTTSSRLAGGEHLQLVLQEGIAELNAAPYATSTLANPTPYPLAARKGVTFTYTVTQITDRLQRILVTADDGTSSRVQTIFKGDR